MHQYLVAGRTLILLQSIECVVYVSHMINTGEMPVTMAVLLIRHFVLVMFVAMLLCVNDWWHQ